MGALFVNGVTTNHTIKHMWMIHTIFAASSMDFYEKKKHLRIVWHELKNISLFNLFPRPRFVRLHDACVLSGRLRARNSVKHHEPKRRNVSGPCVSGKMGSICTLPSRVVNEILDIRHRRHHRSGHISRQSGRKFTTSGPGNQ
jgi:hypothetical protein